MECDIVEHKAGLDSAVDDITALGAMKKGKMTSYVETLMYKVLLCCCCGSVSILCAFPKTLRRGKHIPF